MKILNLYAGIGGNRRLWGYEHQITAVEHNAEIADIYKSHFPNDIIFITDAHQYLLDHYNEFDFIWSSPPCQTHTQLMRGNVSRWNYRAYPDMALYQEIIWLNNFYKGLYCVENVKSYYEPLIKPKYIGKHYIWSNFHIPDIKTGERGHDRKGGSVSELQKIKGFNLGDFDIQNKRQILRNCTESEVGRHVLEYALKELKPQPILF